ncbi:MAG TPA: membrane protein insertase YidC, partial [Prolixibacteraceae bacterium]|nr:membrane protein insertase YidC [Prolixibacteraceae bacterium]
MDRNAIVGIVLIFAILVVFSIVNQPSQEEVEEAKRRRDSIALVEAENARVLEETRQMDIANQQAPADTASYEKEVKQKIDELGAFGKAAIGSEQFYTLENNLMKITFSNKGGKIYSVELLDYQTHDSLPLILFENPEHFGLSFFSQNRSVETAQLFFEPTVSKKNIVVSGPPVKKTNEGKIKFNNDNPGASESIGFRVEVAPGKYLEYNYALSYNSYLVDFDVNMLGMNQYIASNQSFLNFNWAIKVPRQERPSRFGEDRYTTINYKFFEDEVDELNKNKSDEESLSTSLKWISFKQLFFNSTLIADQSFPNAFVRSEVFEEDPEYLSNFYAEIALPYEGSANEKIDMSFYFGPNHYQT